MKLLYLIVVLHLAHNSFAGSCREAKLCCPGRDSSCVVQKAPINAIIEDLSDKPCYCDHACLKLGDCCTDFKEACGVVDCVVSPWGPWSACDAECGSGTMSRARAVQLQPRNGGRRCPSLQQRRGCQVGACHGGLPHAHDPAAREGESGVWLCLAPRRRCLPRVVSPCGPWSACDAECGSGTMSRARAVQLQPRNGGRRCPSLQQRRGCQVGACHGRLPHAHDPAAREMAMILPGSLSLSRHINETSDIRRNLRMRDPKDHPEYDRDREYCVEFEVLKASKACRKEPSYSTLREGERICVRCESEAQRKALGWRCAGHGSMGRSTRWAALAAPHCHGKWLRATDQADATCTAHACSQGPANATFIFV